MDGEPASPAEVRAIQLVASRLQEEYAREFSSDDADDLARKLIAVISEEFMLNDRKVSHMIIDQSELDRLREDNRLLRKNARVLVETLGDAWWVHAAQALQSLGVLGRD